MKDNLLTQHDINTVMDAFEKAKISETGERAIVYALSNGEVKYDFYTGRERTRDVFADLPEGAKIIIEAQHCDTSNIDYNKLSKVCGYNAQVNANNCEG